MLVVDYQSKSYHRFLHDLPQIAKHKTRFLITCNGGSEHDLNAALEDFASYTGSTSQRTTAITDKASATTVTALFSDARNSRELLVFDNADLLFDKKTDVKNSHERDTGFDLNNLFKSIAKHNGIVILAPQNKQTLSSTMSTKVDILLRFPSL